jgi:hypothetical protein
MSVYQRDFYKRSKQVERESGEGGRGAHGKKLTNFCL